MTPNLPTLDLSLASSWISAVVSVFWPALSVLIGVLIGAIIIRAFRRALAGGGE